MADGIVKIDITADDSEVKEKIDETEESLKGLEDGQKRTQKETENTTTKFKELAETIDKQSEELRNLKGDYTEAIINFGKGSAEAKALEDKISSLNSELSKNKETFATAANKAKDLTSALDENTESFSTADVAIGSFIGNALSNLSSKLMETVGNIMALADETREYREDMAKLETSFTTNGKSVDTATAAYDRMYKIIGESDQTVEAAQQISLLAQSEENVAKWADLAGGVVSKFGDALQPETFYESANETLKLGEATGAYTQMLEGTGYSVDEFNKGLAACRTEAEKEAYMLEVTQGILGASAAEYDKATASTQAARDATNRMEQAQAALGAAIEPVTTAWTNMKAGALEWFVNTGLPMLQTGWNWIKDNLPAIAVIVGGLTAAWLAFGGAQTVLNAVQTAGIAIQTALNAVMNANPIGLIILAITALVAGFMILWNNCEGFRNFWIGLWEKIKAAAGAVAEWFKAAWTATLDWFKEAVAKIKEFFSAAWDGIKNVFNNSIIGNYFKAIWETIKAIFAVVKNVLSGNWSEAWAAIKGIVNTWAGFFSGIWEKIKGVFSVVGSWFSQKFTEAKDNIMMAFSNIKEKFSEIWTKIKEAFNISDMLNIGKDLLTGLWNGISDKVTWLKDKVKGVVDKIKSWFTGKDGFDEHSPSKWSEEVAVNVNKGSGIGFEKSTDIPVKAAKATTDRIKTAVSLENARMAQGVGVRDTGFTEVAQAVGMQTAGINSLASEYRRGSNAQVTVPLILDGREVGKAFVDLSNAENTRYGAGLVLA